MARRIAVLGGSFDPIHHGHLAIAQEVAWALGIERVLLVPTGQQPFKQGRHGASADHRLAMVTRACAADPLIEHCAIETHRAGPSYTVDTMRELRGQLPAATELVFILGADALADLPRWREAAALLDLCHFAVVERPTVTVDLAALDSELPGLAARLTLVPGPDLEISGTDLRRRLAAGQPVRYQLPDQVLAYIAEHGLYRTSDADA